ncbi:reverse transcriptase domain-containing protein [Tanacetum coccineum]
MNCPVVVEAMIEGFKVRRIHVDGGSSSEVMYEHCFRNLSYQTRSRLRESRIPLVRFLGEVSYPMGVIDLEVTMGEYGRTRTVIMEFTVVKSPYPYNALLDPTPMQTSSKVANPRVSLALVETRSRMPEKEPMQLDDMEGRRQPDKGRNSPKSGTEEKIVNVDIFVWTPVDMTGIPRAITKHSLDTYPHIEPKAQKKSSLAPNRRKVVTDEVNEWLKAGIIDWKIESLMGFQYKCFLDAYNGYHQIHMTKKDEEKMAFHTEEGVFCYTKMPFGLKNAGVTYQRLVDSAFKEQIGVNLEGYVDDMVIKSMTEQDIIKDIEQTFSTLQRINMKLNPKKCSFGMEEGKFLGYIVTSEGIRTNPEKAKAVMDMPSPKTHKQMQSLNTLKKCTNKKDFRWTKAAEATFLEMKKLVSELPTLTTPKKGETLMMYLATANKAVSAVLLMKKDGKQMPIHYVSRSLQGVETNYAPMKKLALALVHVGRLRRYFQAHPIKVITDSPIGQVLNNSGALGRLVKWAVELGAYGITYILRVTVKGQVLADFLADTPTEINATPEVANNPRVEDIPESLNTREDLTPGLRAWRLYTDRASNNEGSGAGLILIAPNNVEYSYALRLNFSNSNNYAEYEALLAGLRLAKEMRVKDIHAFMDSKLVASQVEGSYEAKGERMIKYRERSWN